MTSTLETTQIKKAPTAAALQKVRSMIAPLLPSHEVSAVEMLIARHAARRQLLELAQSDAAPRPDDQLIQVERVAGYTLAQIRQIVKAIKDGRQADAALRALEPESNRLQARYDELHAKGNGPWWDQKQQVYGQINELNRKRVQLTHAIGESARISSDGAHAWLIQELTDAA